MVWPARSWLCWRSVLQATAQIPKAHFSMSFQHQLCSSLSMLGSSCCHTVCLLMKVVDLPKGPHDPCSFFDVYTEVQILEQFQEEPQVCQILDYGIDCNSFVLVLKHYKCSLRTWRHHHTCRSLVDEPDCNSTESKTESYSNLTFHERLPLYLEVYAAVLQAVNPRNACTFWLQQTYFQVSKLSAIRGYIIEKVEFQKPRYQEFTVSFFVSGKGIGDTQGGSLWPQVWQHTFGASPFPTLQHWVLASTMASIRQSMFYPISSLHYRLWSEQGWIMDLL